MRHANQSIFAQIKGPNVERSRISSPMIHKTTHNPDYIYPIFKHKVLPSDSHSITMHNFVRMTNPLKSVPLDNLWLDTFWFYVPNRIVWDKFQRFMGEQDNPDDSTDFTYPKLDTYTGNLAPGKMQYQFESGSLYDFFQLPTQVDFPHASLADNFINVMYLRAYNLIMHYWFRNQNFMDAPYLTRGDGPDPMSWEPGGTGSGHVETYKLWKRSKNKDYFTSCLPEPQKGPEVTIPIGENAPVFGTQYGLHLAFDSGAGKLQNNNSASPAEYQLQMGNQGVDALKGAAVGTPRSSLKVVGLPTKSELVALGATDYAMSGLYADLEEATATTINEFRLLFATQRYYERKMRGGSRYKELVQSFFGVSVPDFRVQWPELLAISSQNMNTNEIMQSSGTGASGTSTALGQLAGQCKSSSSRYLFNKSFVEHGMIIGLANIRADITYWQGIDRDWTDSTVFDEFWPQFGHIGEQAVLKRELCYTGNGTYDNAVFGYCPAWSWLKFKNNKLTGQMRPNAATNFKQWHLAQELTTPELNETFLKSSVPIAQVSSSTLADYFMIDYLFDLTSIRPVPFNTDPGLLDHL